MQGVDSIIYSGAYCPFQAKYFLSHASKNEKPEVGSQTAKDSQGQASLTGQGETAHPGPPSPGPPKVRLCFYEYVKLSALYL